MAHVYADLVAQYTETTGTSGYALTVAVANRRAFGAVLANGDTTDYQVTGVDASGTAAWEVGVGTYASSGATLARTTIRASSTGSAINWGPGVKTVTMVQAAGSIVSTNPATGHIKASGITPANGAIPIGNGADFTVGTISGTANRVTVTNGAGTILLSGPQDLHTGASPAFAGIKVGSRTSATAGESVIISPDASVTGASVKVGVSNSGSGDGSPNVAYFGVDGAALAGVAFFDTGAFGVAGATPIELRTGGSAQVKIIPTASANRQITLRGSNGGNPTISTSSGSLNLLSSAGGVNLDGAVEVGINGTGDRYAFIDLHSNGTPGANDYSARIIRNPGANNILDIINAGTNSIRFLMGTDGGEHLILNSVSGANRYVTIAPSNGGNPTIGTNAGDLALAPASGRVSLNGVSVGTTSPSAGGAGALPATPKGYLALGINGVERYVPFY